LVGSGKKYSTSAVNRPATADPDNSEPVRQNRSRSSMKRVPRFARQGAARIHPANLRCSPSRTQGTAIRCKHAEIRKPINLCDWRGRSPGRPDSQRVSDSGPIVGIGGCAGRPRRHSAGVVYGGGASDLLSETYQNLPPVSRRAALSLSSRGLSRVYSPRHPSPPQPLDWQSTELKPLSSERGLAKIRSPASGRLMSSDPPCGLCRPSQRGRAKKRRRLAPPGLGRKIRKADSAVKDRIAPGTKLVLCPCWRKPNYRLQHQIHWTAKPLAALRS